MNETTAIIGGSGLSELKFLKNAQRKLVRTPYGDPSSPFLIGKAGKRQVVFLQRHGLGHSIPPHKVNYRANIWALKSLGVQHIIAVAATGGIAKNLVPQSLVVPHQVIDYTYGREQTFFDGSKNNVHHIDFTMPYSSILRQHLIDAARGLALGVVEEGVYAATQGPRLESAAEIDRLERDGATIVGMTGMPEASLARELDMHYACLSLVVNPAAGRAEGEVSIEDIKTQLQQGMVKVAAVLQASL